MMVNGRGRKLEKFRLGFCSLLMIVEFFLFFFIDFESFLGGFSSVKCWRNFFCFFNRVR